MNTASLALILHAHLPFVRHPEHEHFLEEDWFFHAITESYIPLLRTMRRLLDDAVPFRLTMSITPTLCAMLDDSLLRRRYVEHLDRLIDFAMRERKRNRKHAQLRLLAELYLKVFHETRAFFVDECKCDLLEAFRQLQKAGALEIVASAATHGLLPLLQAQSGKAARAQILIGRDSYVDSFKTEPIGFWLPECAYAPGLESILQEANIRWFVLDAHGLLFGEPRPRCSVYAPCYTRSGPAAFAREPDASRQVWSARGGYPGHPAYREFYRDAGFDLPLEHLGPVAHGERKFSGLKYYRITGPGVEKDFYDPVAAEHVTEAQATDFFERRRAQLREIGAAGFDPIIIAPFDAELFGHWWFEGPRFLDQFIRKAGAEAEFSLTTPTQYLAAHPTQQIIAPAASTWGENGYFEVWLNETNAWLYPGLHLAAQRMHQIARQHAHDASPFADRVLKQLARELLLAQASDWPFLIKVGTARHYATKRANDHLARFNRLFDQFTTSRVDETFLRDLEWRDNIFPNLNWRYYA